MSAVLVAACVEGPWWAAKSSGPVGKGPSDEAFRGGGWGSQVRAAKTRDNRIGHRKKFKKEVGGGLGLKKNNAAGKQKKRREGVGETTNKICGKAKNVEARSKKSDFFAAGWRLPPEGCMWEAQT